MSQLLRSLLLAASLTPTNDHYRSWWPLSAALRYVFLLPFFFFPSSDASRYLLRIGTFFLCVHDWCGIYLSGFAFDLLLLVISNSSFCIINSGLLTI